MLDKKRSVVTVVILSVLSMLVQVGFTACICMIFRMLYEKAAWQKYWAVIALAAACILLKAVLQAVIGGVRNGIGAEVKKSLRQKMYDKIVVLGVNSTDQMHMAALTQVSMEGIEQLDLYYSNYLPQFFYAMIAPIILFGICVGIDTPTALVLLACVPLIPLSIVAVSKYAKRIFAKYWDKYMSMGDAFLDSLQGMKELKIFNADGEFQTRMNNKSEEFRKITMKVLVMQLASTTIMDTVAFGGAGIGIAVAISGVLTRGLSPFAALFLILVAAEFFLPLRALGSAFHVAMNGASAGKKIYELLCTPDPQWGKECVESSTLTLQDIVFGYDSNRLILDHIDMKFDKGMTAIVGESGSGKSTIVSLLTGKIRPDFGQVLVGEKELTSLSRSDYYAHLCVVQYNTYVFRASIRDNFRLAKPDVSDSKIWQSLQKVNLDEFVAQNGGLDKVIQDDGENISGGQKQRLALAVNLVTDKSVYIFDEATSNIDIESEAIIMQNILALAKEKCVIVISHRLENVVNANMIYLLRDGKIAEQGNHVQLCAADGEYARLYRTQKNLEQGYWQECTTI